MPKNPLIFPNEFLLDGTASDSGIGALEIAVNNLNIASKSGAMRQANAIRVSGLNSIKNQNRGMPTLNSLLPTRSVGKFTVQPSEPTGTVGYFISGWGNTAAGNISNQRLRTDRFTFATDTIANLGNQIRPHFHFVCANTTSGYILTIVDVNTVWRLTFQTETYFQIGATLFPARYQGASLKNQSRGYACAGNTGGTVYGDVDRFTFAGEICVSIGSILQTRNGNSGFGNKFNGYIGGGLSNGINTSTTSNLEKFAYASESKTNIAASLSVARSGMSTWIPGSTLASYLMTGQAYGSFPTPGVSATRFYYSNVIDKFTFTGETCSPLGSTLTKGRCTHGAVGNATRCVIGGGITHSDAYNLQNASVLESNEITGFTFATETNAPLGSVLSVGRHYLSAVDNASL
jgi:hypothetical protein